MNTFDGGACAMYAFEKEIPKISQTKLDGLSEFYQITTDKATEYFKLHTEMLMLDMQHLGEILLKNQMLIQVT